MTYALLLLLGAGTTSLVTAAHLRPDLITDHQRSTAVIIMSIAASLIGGFTTYMDPAQRWMSLRGAALKLEVSLAYEYLLYAFQIC